MALDLAADPEAFRQLESTHQIVVVVFYRGRWCAVCCAWLSRFQDTQPALETFLEQYDACLVFVSAQEASEMHRLVDNIPCLKCERVYLLADERTEFTRWWNKRGYGQVFISPTTKQYGYRYSHGLLQPALFILHHGECMYKWCSLPNVRNLGGATGRPDPPLVLAAVTERFASDAAGSLAGGERTMPATRERTWVFFRRIVRRLFGKF
jgi:peroxiredoxin